MNRLQVAALMFVLAHLSVGCSTKSPTQPHETAPPPGDQAPPPITVKTLALAADAHFATIGETAQLTGTATYTDDTVKDVTSDMKWYVDDPSVVSVSPSGLVTVLRFGLTYVYGMYQSRYGSMRISATPPDTFTVSGSVREPGQGALGNVRVLDTRSGRSTTTSVEGLFDEGEFSLGDLRQDAHLRIEPDGYEPVEIDAPADGPPLEVKMQRIIRASAGQTLAPVTKLAFDDVDYTLSSGADCLHCRLVRISVPAAGTLHLRLTWLGTASLALWVNGQQYPYVNGPLAVTVDAPVDAGESVVYVQFLNPRANQSIQFFLDTLLR